MVPGCERLQQTARPLFRRRDDRRVAAIRSLYAAETELNDK
jgi:hypothetical protein